MIVLKYFYLNLILVAGISKVREENPLEGFIYVQVLIY